MKAFFQLRLKKHQKHMMRYMKYVLNDHFVLILTFLVGGIGFYYSSWVKTLPTGFGWGKFMLVAGWLISLHLGRFVSLAKQADQVFLLPKEKQMREYLSAAFRYSCLFPFAVLLFFTTFTMPLVVVSTGKGFILFFCYLLSLWALKLSYLEVDRLTIFQDMKKARQNAYLLWLIIALMVLAISLWINAVFGMLLAFAQVVLFYKLCWQTMNVPLDWGKMILQEESRLNRLYHFINLFTDVPEVVSKVKRRSYLDFLLQGISFTQKNTYLYLYLRRFLRGTDYSGLYLRLTFLGVLLLSFVSSPWLALGLGVLFIYLIGFQLLPLYQQFQYVAFTSLYPLKSVWKQQSIKKMIGFLLTATALFFALISLWTLSTWTDRAIVSIAFFLIVALFTQFYLPYRIKKMTA